MVICLDLYENQQTGLTAFTFVPLDYIIYPAAKVKNLSQITF